MGRHSARRSRRAAEAVEGRDRGAGQRLRSHRPEFAALDRRRQLGIPARRSRHARRVSRHPDERRAGARRSRQAGPARRARLVWLLVDQVGQRNPSRRAGRTGDIADGGVRGTHAPERTAQVRARLRARRHPDRRHPGARREAQGPQRPRISHRRHRLGRHQAGRSAGRSASATISRSRRSPFVPCRRRTRCGRCGNTAGSRRSPAPTTSRSKSPINRCRSGASSRAITCGRSEIEEI